MRRKKNIKNISSTKYKEGPPKIEYLDISAIQILRPRVINLRKGSCFFDAGWIQLITDRQNVDRIEEVKRAGQDTATRTKNCSSQSK